MQNEIGAVDEQGTIVELRVLGEGLGAEIGASVGIELQNKLYVPLHDLRGNIVALLNPQTAEVVESYRYDAFGNEQHASLLGNPWRFSSKRVDDETGLVYFGRRYYDPGLGKWLTMDPLGLKGGPNLYAYVLNNPLIRFDLYGLLAVNIEYTNQLDGGFDSSRNCDRDRANCERSNRIESYRIAPPFKQDLSNSKSRWLQAGEKIIPGIDIVVVNGVDNTENEALEHLELLSKMLGDVQVRGLYNATHWIGVDLVEVISQVRTDMITPPSVMYANYLIEYHIDHPEGGKCYTLCFSQGAAVVRNGLSLVPEAIRDRTIIQANGPAAIISRNTCSEAANFISKADPIPSFDIQGFKNNDNIHYLDPHPDANQIFDHAFQSPTYMHVNVRELYRYIHEYREDGN